MNNPISSWLRQGAIPLALVCLAGPALASRTVTSSDSGGGGRDAIASGNLNVCGVDDFWRPADACGGFFNYGEDSNAVQSLVSTYDLGNPNVAWANSATRIDSQSSTTSSTLFTATLPDDISGQITFQQNLTGSFVVVLSGTWVPSISNLSTSAWSAYYLFDDVTANRGQWLNFSLYGADLPLTAQQNPNSPLDAYVMNALTVDKVSIYQYATVATANVPEPSSLLLSGLALGALGVAAARVRRRRPSTGTAQGL